jgi:hypothetical protein
MTTLRHAHPAMPNARLGRALAPAAGEAGIQPRPAPAAGAQRPVHARSRFMWGLLLLAWLPAIWLVFAGLPGLGLSAPAAVVWLVCLGLTGAILVVPDSRTQSWLFILLMLLLTALVVASLGGTGAVGGAAHSFGELSKSRG